VHVLNLEISLLTQARRKAIKLKT